jgi:hypothetical protein
LGAYIRLGREAYGKEAMGGAGGMGGMGGIGGMGVVEGRSEYMYLGDM